MNEQLQLQDQMLRFGGGGDTTTLAVGTAIFVVITILLMFLLPKKQAIIPYIFVSLFIPYSQVVMVGGLHFNVYRILLPFVWIRAFTGRRDDVTEKFKLSGIDKVVLLWAFADALCASLQWATWGAVVNRFGFLYNVLGIYFALRLLIRTREDVNRVVKSLAVACVFLAVFMIFEQKTGRNMFSIFGGVSEFTAVRDGKIRSQAAFAHAIVAGTVGANLLPLFIGLWWQKEQSKKLAVAGAIAALVMVVTCSSATPVGAVAGAIAALSLWTFRHRMRILRWGIVTVLVGLDIVMKAPVWALIQRINIVGGNSGYHRYELVNQAIMHFGQWWLVGFQNPSSLGLRNGRCLECIRIRSRRGWIIDPDILHLHLLAELSLSGIGQRSGGARRRPEAGIANLVIWRGADGDVGSVLRNHLFRPKFADLVVTAGDDWGDNFDGTGESSRHRERAGERGASMGCAEGSLWAPLPGNQHFERETVWAPSD